jgi:hypothetical protein
MDSLGFLNNASIKLLITLSRINHYYHNVSKNVLDLKTNDEFVHEFLTISNFHDNIYGTFNIKHYYVINHTIIYKHLKHWYDNYSEIYVIDDNMKYNYNEGLKSTINIKMDYSNLEIKIKKKGIKCLITAYNNATIRIDYEFITNILKEAIFISDMYNPWTIDNLPKLKYLLKQYRSTWFIKYYLSNYIKLIGKHNYHHIFNQLALDKRVDLKKYIKIDYVKDKLIYRCWLIKQLCKIDYDNMIDICKIYL